MSLSKFFKEAIGYRLAGGHAADHKALLVPTMSSDGTTLVKPDGSSIGLATMSRNTPIRKRRAIGFSDFQYSTLTLNTDFSCTSRLLYTAKEATTSLQLMFDSGPSVAGIAGSDFPLVNTNIYRVSVEYPLGTTPTYFSLNGQNTFVVNPNSGSVLTDILGIQIPDGGSFAIRTFARVSKAPTAANATAVTGGVLTAATTYYYTVTTIDNGSESGPLAEFSGTTGAAGTLALNIAWAVPTYGDRIRIYRSAASGGTKQLLTEISAATLGWTDYGLISQNTAVTPPTANLSVRTLSRNLQTGETTNRVLYGGAGTDQTGVSGTISGQSGFGPAGPGPSMIIGSGALALVIGGEGDSIQAGIGIPNTNGLPPGSISAYQSNWFSAGCIARGLNYYNASIGGAVAYNFLNGAMVVRGRVERQTYCDYLISDLSTNDIYSSGRTWQQVAKDVMTRAKASYANGAQYIPTTGCPRVNSTDGWTTVTNQTQLSSEAVRINYNTWVRNGMQWDGINSPLLSGGTKYPYLTTYFDMANAVEVNASNVLTQNGGYFIAPAGPTYSGLILSGTPTTTAFAFTTSPFTVPTGNNYSILTNYVKVTSGTQNGVVGMVSAGTMPTINSLTLYAPTSTTLTGIPLPGFYGAPSAGDTVNIYSTYVTDSVHPTLAGYGLISTAFNAFLATIGA